MNATVAAVRSGVVSALSRIAWQELTPLLAGVLLLLLAGLMLYRRRRKEKARARRIPLVGNAPAASPSPSQAPRPAVPQPALFPERAVERNLNLAAAATPAVPLQPPPAVAPQSGANGHRRPERWERLEMPATPVLPAQPSPRNEVAQRPDPAPFTLHPVVPREAERGGVLVRAAATAEDGSEEVKAGLVRFHRPPEGTLQLLPGRLDIVAGQESVDVIRFVKVPGREPIVTFGRSRGEPHRHVELQSPTVSRRHAAMRFDGKTWQIANLSTTNPVVLRGKQLTVTDPPARLEDGDQIEMGEVTFRFHTRHVVERAPEVRLADRLLDELPRRLAEGRVGIESADGRPGWASGALRRPPHTVARARALTGREIEVARLIAAGRSNQAIGDVLHISPRTVSTHLTNIFRKLDLVSRGELVAYMSNNAAAEERPEEVSPGAS
jgi:LPXTG-motif cell wall-anchored protein